MIFYVDVSQSAFSTLMQFTVDIVVKPDDQHAVALFYIHDSRIPFIFNAKSIL